MRGHDENRGKVCVLCFKKAKQAKSIHQTLKSVIVAKFLPDYNENNQVYPKVLCGSCYLAVYRCSKGVPFKQIAVHNYSMDHVVRTRKKANHDSCQLCKVARETLNSLKPLNQKEPERKKKTDVLKVCSSCLTEISPGKSHVCSKKTKIQNLLNISGDVKEQLVTSVIRNTKSDSKNAVQLSNIHGRRTRITVGNKPSSTDNVISHQEIMQWKADLNLSLTKTIRLAKNIRRGKRTTIQPRLQSGLQNMVHELDDFFEVITLDATLSSGSSKSYPIVVCKTVNGLIDYIKARRNVDDCRIKIGIDGGQGSFKICLNIEESSDSSTDFKDSGVRRSIILALAPNVPENYDNVSKIWTHLQLQSLGAVVSGDLKIINILAGVMANSAMYPCAYCTSSKPDLGSNSGAPRTIGSIRRNAQLWVNGGQNKKHARNYFNCAHNPLLEGGDNDTILSKCPPPVLHLFLGLMNRIFDAVAKVHKKKSEAWASAANATRHAQFGFAGRHCRNLLAKREILKGEESDEYFIVLESLQRVVESCFGINLLDYYSEAIGSFCDSWAAAGLPITPKFHILKFHVPEFCGVLQEGLAKYSEQTTEAIHRDFDIIWQNYKMPENHEQYASKLYSAVVAYNSSHIM